MAWHIVGHLSRQITPTTLRYQFFTKAGGNGEVRFIVIWKLLTLSTSQNNQSPSKILKPLQDLLYTPGTPVPRDFSPSKLSEDLWNRVQQWRSGDHNPGPNTLRMIQCLRSMKKPDQKPKRVKMSRTRNQKRRKLCEFFEKDYSESSLSAESSSISSGFY
nr:ORF3 [Torque teno felis virus]